VRSRTDRWRETRHIHYLFINCISFQVNPTMSKPQLHSSLSLAMARRTNPRMSRLLPVAALALMALAGSGTVLAQSYKPAGPVASMFTPGTTYIALNAGVSDLSRNITGLGVLGSAHEGQSYSIAMGNYFAGQNYGLEVAYADFGSVNRYGGNTKVDGISLSVLGRLPVGSNFNLLGKIGTTYGRTDVSTNQMNTNLAGSERGFDWSYGVGAEYMITPQWSATLQYAEHFVKYPVTGSERVSSTMLGARFYY
jgi:opacity protein-like surface antigen